MTQRFFAFFVKICLEESTWHSCVVLIAMVAVIKPGHLACRSSETNAWNGNPYSRCFTMRSRSSLGAFGAGSQCQDDISGAHANCFLLCSCCLSLGWPVWSASGSCRPVSTRPDTGDPPPPDGELEAVSAVAPPAPPEAHPSDISGMRLWNVTDGIISNRLGFDESLRHQLRRPLHVYTIDSSTPSLTLTLSCKCRDTPPLAPAIQLGRVATHTVAPLLPSTNCTALV